jgi:Flp pilus assembly protein TadD
MLLESAVALHQQHRLDEAEAIYRTLLAREPRNAHVLQLLGVIAYQRGLPQDACELLEIACTLSPAEPDIYNNLGLALMACHRYDKALLILQRGHQLDRRNASILTNMGVCYAEMKDDVRAEATYQQVLQINPHAALVYNNIGKLAHNHRDYARAEAYYRRALSCDSQQAEATANLATLLFDQGRFQEAEPIYRQVIALNPYLFVARHNRALGLLAMGQFAEGWHEYVYRIPATLATRYLADPREPQRVLPSPHDVVPFHLSGKRLWLMPEQGIGDELFFLRFVPYLRKLGAWVAYQPTAKILPLVMRSGWVDAVVRTGDPVPAVDGIFAVGDVPLLLGMSRAEDIPPPLGLAPLPAARAAALQWLAQYPRPWVGLTWEAGSRHDPNSIYKRWPVEEAAAVFRAFPGTVVILQRGMREEDRCVVAQAMPQALYATEWSNDLEQMLGLLDVLEAYITVSNTNVHLRAMLGKVSDVILPLPPEFRWMIEGERSPWYPEYPLYRQPLSGAWEGVRAALMSRLRELT